MRRQNARALLVLCGIGLLFYWKVILTGQFSAIADYEGANQTYAWYQFIVSSLKSASLPLWDPYSFSGHSFIGEMQTGVFYPFNLLLALVPLNANGLIFPGLYHVFLVFNHVLAAYFMYLLTRDLGLPFFPSLLAGICFSFGGLAARVSGWPHLLQSAIWTPLLFLFMRRALLSPTWRARLRYSSWAGLCLGVAALAGGLHIVIMQAILVIAWAAFCSLVDRRAFSFLRSAVTVLFTGIIAAGIGAVQLIPSFEYSRLALRYLGNVVIPASERIPYAYLQDALSPQAIIQFLIPAGFGGRFGPGEVMNPYLGVFPILLAALGAWKRRNDTLVRFLAGLALLSFVFSLGAFSPLHGWLYALAPELWMAREAGRFLFLADFALAILAAYGAEILIIQPLEQHSFTSAKRVFNWVAIGLAAALAIPALFGTPDISPWVVFSFLLILCSWAIFHLLLRGHRGSSIRLLIVIFTVFDLSAFDWSILNLIQLRSNHSDEMERLLSCRPVARFLETRPAPFRLDIQANRPPNLGDVFHIQTTWGAGATVAANYDRARGTPSLFNARYILKPATSPDPNEIYRDASWKVYENASAIPRAWIVHATETMESEQQFTRMRQPGFDARRTALLEATPPLALDPASPSESLDLTDYRADAPRLLAHTSGRALLVMSELFYPGWRATINGKPAPIFQVDGTLRGILLPAGESRVAMRYEPLSVIFGGATTFATAIFTLLISLPIRFRHYDSGERKSHTFADQPPR